MRKQDRIAGDVAERLETEMINELSDRRPWCGLRWSPNAPTDGSDASILVVDEDGTEYGVEIEVFLTPTRPRPVATADVKSDAL
jgi:hypothetical protein